MKDVLCNLHYASTRRPEEESRKKDGLEVSLEPGIEDNLSSLERPTQEYTCWGQAPGR
jgi:hypothetical protein